MNTWYATGRDSDGIPIYCRSRRAKDPPGLQRLRHAADLLRFRYRSIDFLRSWVLPRDQRMPGHCCERDTQVTKLGSEIETEIRSLERHYEDHGVELELLLGIQGMMGAYILGRAPIKLPRARSGYEPLHEPQFLLRLQHTISHTSYSPKLGFLSSGFWNCHKLTEFGNVLKSNAASAQELKEHCHANREPSSWISLTGSASWLVEKLVGEAFFQDARVAFIDVETLKNLAVLYQRSDLLAHQSGICRFSHVDPEGLQMTHPQHWLAYAWIPPQSIVHVASLKTFEEKYRSCKKGKLFEVNAASLLIELLHCARNCQPIDLADNLMDEFDSRLEISP